MSVNVQACGDMDCNKHEGIRYIEFGQNVHLFSAEPDFYIKNSKIKYLPQTTKIRRKRMQYLMQKVFTTDFCSLRQIY